jgi:DNA ligase 1
MKPMLAKDANLAKLTFPVIVQPKLDGIRCVIKDGKPHSRTLKLIPNLEIQAALSDPRLEGLDGELIVGEPTANGCMQATTSFVMAPNKTGEPWTFWVFDKWDHAGDYTSRQLALTVLVEAAQRENISVVLVASSQVYDHDQLAAWEELYVGKGWEGVIVRIPDSAYKFGRSGVTGPLLKVKRFTDFEAKIVGVYEEQHNGNEATRDAFGRTERSSKKAGKTGKGTLGGFVLEALNGPWSGVEFRCGTGFNAEQRQKFWTVGGADCVHDFWVGQGLTVKVKAFEVGAKDKPRFPTFLGFRDMEIDG